MTKGRGILTIVGDYTEVKAQSELANDVNSQSAIDILVLGHSIDAEGHDDLSNQLDKSSLNHLDHHQVITPVGEGGCKFAENASVFPKARTADRRTSIENRD